LILTNLSSNCYVASELKQDGATWIDSSGYLWMFSGQGLAQTTSPSGNLSDLWRYSY